MPNSIPELAVGYLLPTIIFFGSYLFSYFKVLKPQADKGNMSPYMAVALAVALGLLLGCTISLIMIYIMMKAI